MPADAGIPPSPSHAADRQLAEMQRLAGLGSWEWDVVGDRVTWSDELYRIYGVLPEELPATFAGYLERVHPDDRAGVRDEIEAAFQSGGRFEFEERIVRPDGEVRVLRSRGNVLRGEDGRAVRLSGACMDITELRAAETRALELAREQVARAAAESTATGLRLLVEASEALASSLDYEETLRTVAWMVVPDFADWCAVDLVVPGGTLRRVTVAHPDPHRVALARRVMERYPPRRDAATGPWKVIDSGEADHLPEITDAMLAGAAVDAEHLRVLTDLGLRSAVVVPLAGRTGILGAMTMVHAESGRRMSETDVAIARELGRHAALAIENARLLLESERQNELLEAQTAEMQAQAEELQSQAQQLEELVAELEESGERLRRRTREAEEANLAKSQFLAAMSHELRTPLNAIVGYAELIDLGVHGPVTGAQRESLDRIKRNQRTLLALVNDVLNFARLEAGKLEMRISDLPADDLVRGLETMVAPQLRAGGLRYDAPPVPAGMTLRGDRERVEQILLNLLTNSIKFTAPGGVVTVEVRADADRVRISVSDTGSGIPPERLHTVFDPFVQLARFPGAPGEHGVGLGLAISRELATAMGGELTVTSEVGVGSTFTLTLPHA
jgi:signal transduction histidine kinase